MSLQRLEPAYSSLQEPRPSHSRGRWKFYFPRRAPVPMETQLGALPIEPTQTAPSVADPEQCARLYELAGKLAKEAASVPKAEEQAAGGLGVPLLPLTPLTSFLFSSATLTCGGRKA